ncbi:Uncharacterized protein TCM_004344 [Theobroma cacao]|uniref:Uncharacterized protein n=1 Tax=Theobroma cacao TaxID=3641 RepID=A0A061DXL7_THECC|nr:Uncharacterized protein TCM_004344 [Theobroma cacao]
MGKSKQQRKQINALKREDNSWRSDPLELERLVVHFFMNLYTNNGVSKSLLSYTYWRLDLEKSSTLAMLITSEEIKHAFFNVHPNKTSGYNGFPASFF